MIFSKFYKIISRQNGSNLCHLNVQVEAVQKEEKDHQEQYNVQTVVKQFQKTKQRKIGRASCRERV